MIKIKKHLHAVPGWISSVLMILVTYFWTFWGTAEMYHEGWWGAWHNRLPYMVPIAVTLLPTLLAFRWPVIGGGLIAGLGVFALFFFGFGVAFIGGIILLVGLGFIADGLIRHPAPTREKTHKWFRQHWRSVTALGGTMLIFAITSIVNLPVVLTRVDDGDRSMHYIDGNDVTLIWAPEGPGWNWKQPWGGFPSWQSIALYGLAPVGLNDKPGYGRQAASAATLYAGEEEMTQYNLCRFLNADGTLLMDEPQDIWRMPDTDEVVRSLLRHGDNTGCTWQGEIRRQVQCEIRPDKESPLWSTDQPVVYYWTADSYSDNLGYFVAYNGMVNAAQKTGGNPRHG